ncbi:unnamed protein product [Aphanomyces euteiches]
MTSKVKLQCMVKGCGAIVWYTSFAMHMKNQHKDIPEARYIRIIWGRPVLDDGSLAPYTPPK